MKALTIASLSALAFVGVACSESGQTAEVTPETDVMDTAQASPTDEESGFNLNLFDNDAGSGGFNIGFEDDASDPLTGFDFGDSAGGSLLGDIPSIEALVIPGEEDLVKLPEIPDPDTSDEIIRLPQ